MSLANKHRPSVFEEVIGNENTIKTLHKLIEKESPPHAYLLQGQTGCGKTTLARIISKCLGVKGNDYRELDSASYRGIDSIREMRKQCHYAPLEGKCLVWVLDECHKLTNDAQNALLKLLEDTPKHVYLILCTTDPQKLLPTIKGRCSKHQVNPLKEEEMMRLLRTVVRSENENLSREIYQRIITESQGFPRNALQILEKTLAADPEMRISVIEESEKTDKDAIELARALMTNKPWKVISQILSGLEKEDPEKIRMLVLYYCKSVLLKNDNPTAGLIMECFVDPFYNTHFPGLVFACYSVIKN